MTEIFSIFCLLLLLGFVFWFINKGEFFNPANFVILFAVLQYVFPVFFLP